MGRERIHYLDWLKVLIVYGILLFHVSLVFTNSTWLVSNRERSGVLSAFAGFCFPWGIPAMFWIAGADAFFGTRSTRPAQFVWKRVLRLLIPMVAGLFLISPYQRFVTSHNPPPPWSQYPSYYVHFFQGIRFETDPEWISKYWLHLWFLGYLFALSVVCLPLLVWLRTAGGKKFIADLVQLSKFRGGLFIMPLPLFIAQLILRPAFPAYQDWADIATYLFVFIAGAVFISDRGFETAIVRDIRTIVAAGVVAVAGLSLEFSHVNFNMRAIAQLSFAEQVAFSLFWTFTVWMWNLAVVYVGIRWLTRSNRVLSYASESVLPFYVIHHPVVVTLASFVVTWPLGLWPKFFLIVVLGYGITIAIYDFGVRRWALMRTVFGLGPVRRAQPVLSSA